MIRSFIFLLLVLGSPMLMSQNTITVGNTVLTERDVATGLIIPWEVLWGPDDHLWVTERQGTVVRLDPNNGNMQTILDIRNEVVNEDGQGGSEYGLLGMALHPEFDSSPKVYLVYTFASNFSIRERLVVFDWNGTNLENQEILIDDIPGASIHDGSRLLISRDNKLLMTTGDRGNTNTSQDLNSINGKLLRINLDGSVPDDNPYPDSYVYSFGHRNSQGLAYGPNDQLYSSEHGAQSSDEFNRIEVNRNYGWPEVQGACNTNFEINYCNANNVVEPLIEWTPCVAVNGLAYYEHEAIPEWNGKMLMAVLGGFAGLPRVSVLSFNEDGTEVTQEDRYFENFGRIRDVCVNPHNGAVYFATNGQLYPGFGPNRIVEYRNMSYVSSVENIENKNQFLKIFPNPVTNVLSVNVSPSFISKDYNIIDGQGRVILSGVLSEIEEDVDVSGLPSGNFFIKVTNEKGTITRMFLKK